MTLGYGRVCGVGLFVLSLCACGGGGGKSQDGSPGGIPEGGARDLAGGDVVMAGVCPAAPRHVDMVTKGKGPATLATMDTDRNGLLDRDEWGPLEVMPADTDHDAIPDHEDTDDDGDGVLDVFDAARVEALLPPADHARAVRIDRVFVEVAEGKVTAAGRPGDTLWIEGKGLGCDTLVVFASNRAAPVNAVPTRLEAGRIGVTLPMTPFDRLEVIAAGVRSHAVAFDLRPANAPLLVDDAATIEVSAGAEVTLKGAGLSGATGVRFGSTVVTPVRVNGGAITFTVPTNASRAVVEVLKAAGPSNGRRLLIRKAVGLALDGAALAAAGVKPPFQVAYGGSLKPADVAASTSITVDTVAPERVVVEGLLADGRTGPVALVHALPTDTNVSVGPRSTAVSLVLGTLDMNRLLVRTSWTPARDLVAGLPEIAALGEALTAALAAAKPEHGALALGHPDVVARLGAAIKAAHKAVADAITAGTLARPPRIAMADVPGEPVINPPERYDIHVKSYGTEGNVLIDNDTALFLSAAVSDAENKTVMVRHVTSGFDPAMIGAQGVIGLSGVFASETKELPAPRFRNAKVRVVTPGRIGGQSLDDVEKRAQMYVMLRTLIDRVIAPLLEEALGGVLPEHALVDLVTTHAIGAVQDAYNAHLERGPAAATAILVNMFKREIEGQGPLFSALVQWIVGVGGEALVETFSKQLAKKVIPGLNVVLQALDLGNTGLGVLKTVFDLNTMPALAEFDVAFKMAVTTVRPRSIERRELSYELELEGYFLYPITRTGMFHIPSVILEDQDPGGAGKLELRYGVDKMYIASNGRKMRVDMQAGYAKQVQGPIKVSVKRGDEIVAAADTISVTSNFFIESLMPAMGAPGDPIVITGKGFTGRPVATVKVSFTEPLVDPLRARHVWATTVRVVSDTRIEATVPMLAEDVSTWVVRVQRGNAGAEEVTNGKNFNAKGSDPVGQWTFRNAGVGGKPPCSSDVSARFIELWPNGAIRGFWPGIANSGACVAADGKEFGGAEGSWKQTGDTITIELCNGPGAAPTKITVKRNDMGQWVGEQQQPDSVVVEPICMVKRAGTTIKGCISGPTCSDYTYTYYDGRSFTVRLTCGGICDPTKIPACTTKPWEKAITPYCTN